MFLTENKTLILQWIPYGYIFLLTIFWKLLLSDSGSKKPHIPWTYVKVVSGGNFMNSVYYWKRVVCQEWCQTRQHRGCKSNLKEKQYCQLWQCFVQGRLWFYKYNWQYCFSSYIIHGFVWGSLATTAFFNIILRIQLYYFSFLLPTASPKPPFRW